MTPAQRVKRSLQLRDGDVLVNGDALAEFIHRVDAVVGAVLAEKDRSVALSVALLDLRDQAVETEKTIR